MTFGLFSDDVSHRCDIILVWNGEMSTERGPNACPHPEPPRTAQQVGEESVWGATATRVEKSLGALCNPANRHAAEVRP